MSGPDLLTVEWVETTRLFCSPSNPRLNEVAVPHVAASIRRFGWRQPIVAKRSGEVIAGNTRLKAAQQLGHDKVPVVWFEGTDLEATAYQIADNKLHELSEWNEPALAKILEQLRAEDALEGVGYSASEIDDLLAEFGSDSGADVNDEGPSEPPVDPVSRPGDLWVLGDHRLLCGDSTKLDDVLRVMGGEKAALVATDPPYLVDYTGERPNGTGKDWTANYREIDIQDADGFFRAVFTNVLQVLGAKAAIYCWHAHKRCGDIQRIWRDLGILDHQQVIWVKPTPVFGRVYWHFRHEPCVMGWKQGDKPEHDGVHEHDSVWDIDWEGKQRVVGNEHPCLHPDALVLTDAGYRPIRSVQVGDRVYAADGAFHAVTHVSSHAYTSPALFRIRALGSNLSTLASDNHPFLVWRPTRQGRKTKGGEVAWLRADELRVGDYTMTPVMADASACPDFERAKEPWFQDRGVDRSGNRITHVDHAGRVYGVRRVKSIETVPYIGDVWNLSVDGCPSFQTAIGMSHNTEKPIEIFARPMRKHTKRGAVVFEPFSGSGSQLIAAEKEGRKCRAIEISPAFVDVAIRRFEKATGKTVLLAETKASYAEVERERKRGKA